MDKMTQLLRGARRRSIIDRVSPFAHGCDPLCDDCLHEQLAQLKGVAQSRGESWARAVATVCPIDKPWPLTEKMRAGARRKVEDMTRDTRLRGFLADEIVVGASRWWNRAYEQAG
jgi:hypothetical protein